LSLNTLAENSMGLKRDRWSTKALELRTYIAELRVIIEQRSAVTQRLLHKLEVNEAYQLITTIPGVGFETGSVLISEIGDVHRFSSDKQLISFAGFDLVNYQSGEYQGKPRISKRGRPLIRKATYQAINSAIISSRPNLFNRKYREIRAKQGNTKDIRKKARIKLCAKLLRIVYAVLTKKQAFRDEVGDQ
jgi:transposase